jgi:hypothetical protein
VSGEFEVEPVPGLPSQLPAGERILWQGKPTWQGLARHTFQLGWVASYFCLLALALGALELSDGRPLAQAILAAAALLPVFCAALGLLLFLARIHARSTVYTITNRRVVLRYGVALPMAVNLPFRRLAAADLGARKGGDGDIALRLSGPDKLAWLHLWPHVRPWGFSKPQPTLLAIPEAARVATLLADAVQLWSAGEAAPVLVALRSPPPPSAPETAHVGFGPPLGAAAGR